MYQSLLSSFAAEVHTAKSSHFHNKINSAPDMHNLFRTFNSLICPPPPPPTTFIIADDFATFFTDKTKTISSQFSPSLTQDLQPTRSSAPTPIFSFCPLTEAEVSRTTNWTLNSQVSGVAIQLRLSYSQSLKPCELQKLIPNHQSSFCWICLPLLTLSNFRSSCPPSHHWTSLGFHFAGLNPISLVGLSRWPGEGRYPKHINWSLGFPRARFLDPSSSPHTLHHWVPSYRHMASPTIYTLMTHSSIYHFDQMIQR